MGQGDSEPVLNFKLPIVVRGEIERFGERGSMGIVAVSGGADSVALLRVLAALEPGNLIVAHLNHQLRGKDSDADAEFVATLCPQLPHRIESVDIAALANEHGDNLEATARRMRYDFLTGVARESGATWVATGHTADDQAETVLHRLIRGTGIRGLRGIAASRELAPGIRLLRPMLTLSRVHVIQYLAEISQSWREDNSNSDLAFTRNRIRHELLPLLRSFNPGITDILGRVAGQSEEVFGEIELQAKQLLEQAELPRAGSICILARQPLEAVSTSLVREVLNLLWAREDWPRGDLTAAHWARAAAVACGELPAWDFPGGIRMVIADRVVRIGPTGGP
jgi:tRNA(Ile)-lysidine synthase